MIKAISLITISIVFLVFTVNINAAIAGNESDSAYSPPPPPPNEVASIRSITLRQLIADGGSHFFKSARHILDLLYTLKKDVDSEIFPNLSYLWSVNQKYSEFKFFGQYVAQVFYRIK